jgi:hypothetical protein
MPWSRSQDASFGDDILLATGREGQIVSIQEWSRAGVVGGSELNLLMATVMGLACATIIAPLPSRRPCAFCAASPFLLTYAAKAPLEL